ncbi:MAG TPA: hypothetical protein VM186_08910 [Planctomycetota bacterium]|nr:hypothetical protein [Planctomycetota bacterium]
MAAESKGRFGWLVRTVLLVAFIGIGIYGTMFLADVVMSRANTVRCEANLRRLGEAMFMYRNQNSNRLPPYLTLLHPQYLEDKSNLICPADPNSGRKGAFPYWARYRPDGTAQPAQVWRDEFAYADLDGPTLVPWKDQDTVPCSYYYRFNEYPCDLQDLQRGVTFRQLMDDAAKEFGDRTPVVSCLWHLPDYPDDDGAPTQNLLYDLVHIERYPRKWELGVGKAEE